MESWLMTSWIRAALPKGNAVLPPPGRELGVGGEGLGQHGAVQVVGLEGAADGAGDLLLELGGAASRRHFPPSPEWSFAVIQIAVLHHGADEGVHRHREVRYR